MSKSTTIQFWHPVGLGRIQCDICPRHCRLREGQRGFCFVRACEGSKIVLTTYGWTSGFAVDPIEKKPLHHFLPGTSVLSFGTAGCNLSCVYCQNWHMSRSRSKNAMSVQATPQEGACLALQQGCPSVAFTYNEPIIFFEYALAVSVECHARGIKTVAVTAGMINEKPRKIFFEHIDAANVDLKGFSQAFYKKNCSGNFQTVLDTLVYLKKETGVWLEITNLLIPGENDADDEIDRMTKWIATELGPEVPLHFSAFHPAHKMLYKPRTPVATLLRAREIALRNGLYYVYTGNVPDTKSQSTDCHRCRHLLIERNGYCVDTKELQQGRCPHCGALCAGVWS